MGVVTSEGRRERERERFADCITAKQDRSSVGNLMVWVSVLEGQQCVLCLKDMNAQWYLNDIIRRHVIPPDEAIRYWIHFHDDTISESIHYQQ